MTGFDGPIIEYSWPSQGKILSYVVDETNMYHDVRNFRAFLTSLAEQQWFKDIVLVSHSLGPRSVVPAVAYVARPSTRPLSRPLSNISPPPPVFAPHPFLPTTADKR